LVGLMLVAGCGQYDARQQSGFSFDRSAFPGATPWTSENFKNDPDDFQFAVIGDRTGGADAKGVFVRAMDQLNLLQPEFVVNVGDVIEGYTEDRAKLDAMWDEAEPMIAKLEMPFFYTVGNHDLNNDVMKEVWLERHGATYYHFVYKNVLFLVLSSEDPPNPPPEGIGTDIELYNRLQVEDPERARAMLEEFMANLEDFRVPANFSDEQVAWVGETLADNPGVRWTFLFLHQPAWEMPSEGFLAIEQLLQDRDYTFIGGHLHYYDLKQRHGRDYITMGPAGASFHHEGPGNVDHLLWVTMGDDGPEIAKITLEGIYDRAGRDLQLREMYQRSGVAP
jgi:3',5'-cyclic AMP phosphodiesterase CpdA